MTRYQAEPDVREALEDELGGVYEGSWEGGQANVHKMVIEDVARAVKIWSAGSSEWSEMNAAFEAEQATTIHLSDIEGTPTFISTQAIGDSITCLHTLWIDGVALSDLEEPLSESEATNVCEDLLRIISAAHERGRIHGDITPSNVLVSPSGKAHLIDWGLVLLNEHGVPGAGTPGFMAPEQVSGLITPSTDLHQLALTLLAAMKTPTHRPSEPEDLERWYHEGNREPLPESLQGSLGQVLDMCLAPREERKGLEARKLVLELVGQPQPNAQQETSDTLSQPESMYGPEHLRALEVLVVMTTIIAILLLPGFFPKRHSDATQSTQSHSPIAPASTLTQAQGDKAAQEPSQHKQALSKELGTSAWEQQPARSKANRTPQTSASKKKKSSTWDRDPKCLPGAGDCGVQ